MRCFPTLSFALFLLLGFLPGRIWAQQLTCKPCSYGFGKVQVGKSTTYSVQLTNSGSKSVTISSKSHSGAGFFFGTFGLPMTVKPGVSVPLPLIFAPSVPGYSLGRFTIVSSAQNSPLYIDVSGTGVTTTLTVTPSTLNFGNVTVGSSATLPATLTAVNGAVTISSDQSNSSKFSIRGLTLPVTIPAGQSIPFKVRFTPNASGTASGKAGFYSNATISPTVEQLTGTGVTTSSTQLTVTPSTLNFGNVTVGSSATLPATLSAVNGAVTISSDQSNSSEFSIRGLTLPVTIPAGQSIPFKVRFTPNASGTASGKAGFFSNATISPTVEQLTGTGVAQTAHNVTLTWNDGDASTVGYNVYRGVTSGGPYQQINTALDSSKNYTDSTVVSGATYYYVTTAVNGTGQESSYSNQAQAVIPNP